MITMLIAITFTIKVGLFLGDLDNGNSHDDSYNITPDHVHDLNYSYVNNHDNNHDHFHNYVFQLIIPVAMIIVYVIIKFHINTSWPTQ